MKIAICQSNYIPWKGYFDMINMADIFVIYDEVQFTKNDWRNRNRIKTRDGIQWLTIPIAVRHKRFQKINEAVVFEKNWADHHWKAIQANYSKSQYFKQYNDFFHETYSTIKSEYLTEINRVFLYRICQLLDFKTKFIDSRELSLKGDKTERLVQACQSLNADVYLTGPAARNYLDERMFNDNKINVEWMNYDGYPEYRQLFPPFEHAVSIIDLIFNEGPDAKDYMKSFKNRAAR